MWVLGKVTDLVLWHSGWWVFTAVVLSKTQPSCQSCYFSGNPRPASLPLDPHLQATACPRPWEHGNHISHQPPSIFSLLSDALWEVVTPQFIPKRWVVFPGHARTNLLLEPRKPFWKPLFTCLPPTKGQAHKESWTDVLVLHSPRLSPSYGNILLAQPSSRRSTFHLQFLEMRLVVIWFAYNW